MAHCVGMNDQSFGQQQQSCSAERNGKWRESNDLFYSQTTELTKTRTTTEITQSKI